MHEQLRDRPLERVASIALVALVTYSSFYSAPAVISGVDPGLDPSQKAGGSVIAQLFYGGLLVIVVISVLMFQRREVLWRAPRFALWILTWLWLSLIWANDPGASMRRLVYTTIILLTASYIVELLPHDRLMRVLTATLAIIVIADWAAVLLVPSATHGLPDPLDPNSGWRGLHQEKNQAGGVLANCLIIFVYETVRTRSRLTGPLLCIASAVFLIETNSKTAIGFVGMAILLGAVCASAYTNVVVRCVGLLAFVAIVLICIGAWDSIGPQIQIMLNDPGAYSGRSQIWTALLAYAREHMLFGAGYGSFWGIGNASPIFAYSNRSWIAVVYEAHDGYLDLLVNVGIIGLTIGIVDLVIRPLWVVFTRPLVAGVSRGMLCGVVTFVCLHNLLESTFLNRANAAWVLAALIYAVLFKRVERAEVSAQSRRNDPNLSLLGGVNLAER